jgi:DNA-binding NtrC family response regulator
MQSILVVEDNSSILEILCETISKAGYEVECVRTRAEAIVALSAKQHDLLVADVRLPDGKTYDLVERATQLGIRTILITGHYDEVSAVAVFNTPYLVKPFPLDSLLEEIIRQLPPTD